MDPLPASPLLLRADFRAEVFARDNGQCVLCREPAQDAHHIIERRLWSDGGYYLDNGVSLCGPHHLEAERTTVSCEELRDAAGISRVLLPDSLESGSVYTKWGDVVFADGRRAPGELFHDENVKKILGESGLLDLYTTYVKYPRTPHLPWSLGRSKDDIAVDEILFVGKEVVVTAKLDGENTTMTRDRLYARSPDGTPHRSQAWVRSLQGKIGWEIPEGWRLCGENLYAEHSIRYEGLPSYFFLFAVWTEEGMCLSWDETREWAALLGLETAPVIYRGPYDEKKVRACHPTFLWSSEAEGYVVRLADCFSARAFRKSVAKFVRPSHVTSATHWRSRQVVPNALA